jgi:phosphatidylinositol alpha-1,6-mannosyltransferase
LAQQVGARAVVVDPALPLGLVGPALGLPYGVVLHGAEVTVPGRLPVSQQLLARAVKRASLVIAAGGYPEAEARRAAGAGAAEAAFPPSVQVPPGVDTERFRPLPSIDKAAARARLGLPAAGPLVVSVSRLVPRKGMDTLIQASSRLAGRFPHLSVAIGGAGRDRHRLERLGQGASVPVKFLGKLADDDLADLYACADVFALCCRSRWWGLEEEGFGIVLLEAAASGVACITVDSGGAAEAVVDGVTGYVVKVGGRPGAGELRDGPPGGSARAGPRYQPTRRAEVGPVAEALAALLSDPARARQMGEAGRHRAEVELSYDSMAKRLAVALDGLAVPG